MGTDDDRRDGYFVKGHKGGVVKEITLGTKKGKQILFN